MKENTSISSYATEFGQFWDLNLNFILKCYYFNFNIIKKIIENFKEVNNRKNAKVVNSKKKNTTDLNQSFINYSIEDIPNQESGIVLENELQGKLGNKTKITLKINYS